MVKKMKEKAVKAMANMMLAYARVKDDQKGASLIEIVLFALIIGVLAILIFKGFGESLSDKASEVRDAINNADTPSF